MAIATTPVMKKVRSCLSGKEGIRTEHIIAASFVLEGKPQPIELIKSHLGYDTDDEAKEVVASGLRHIPQDKLTQLLPASKIRQIRRIIRASSAA